MKAEMPVKIVVDACKKARANPRDSKCPCPLYPRSQCCQEECNVPKFMAWLMGNEVDPANVEEW